ncbi:MAG: alpha/beta hydrolase [Hyphomicrobiaceae bacterium]|nr:alpha/beta hydrolase [Hyphomicrobiaceae bacterium]
MERFITLAAAADARSAPLPLEADNLPALRVAYENVAALFRRPRPSGLDVSDETCPGVDGPIGLRVYRPAETGRGSAPGLVYYHGGGFALGSLDSHDCIVAELAAATGAVAVAVDYRLAPEHPFPAAFEDAVAALSHVMDQGGIGAVDAGRVAVAGDSAGAALVLAASLARRDAGLRVPAALALVYPVLTTAADLPSYVENAEAPMLTAAVLAQYWRLYTRGDVHARDARAAPLLAGDLSGLGPTLITVAGHDPARDDGVELHRRLIEVGGLSELRTAGDLAHGHVRARGMSPSAAIEFSALAEWLAQRLAH